VGPVAVLSGRFQSGARPETVDRKDRPHAHASARLLRGRFPTPHPHRRPRLALGHLGLLAYRHAPTTPAPTSPNSASRSPDLTQGTTAHRGPGGLPLPDHDRRCPRQGARRGRPQRSLTSEGCSPWPARPPVFGWTPTPAGMTGCRPQLLRADSTQNSLPSGSARTTHGDDPCPTSARRAPARRNRSTSACWSSGRKSR
jgi:hypothetical protein